MKSKYLSGAAKRKKKAQQKQHILETNKKIKSFFENNRHGKFKVLFFLRCITALRGGTSPFGLSFPSSSKYLVNLLLITYLCFLIENSSISLTFNTYYLVFFTSLFL